MSAFTRPVPKPPKLALSFVHNHECSACQEMLPEVKKFAAANRDLCAVTITDVLEKAGDFPSATVPAVCLRITAEDGKLTEHIAEAATKPHIMTAEGLEGWIAGKVASWGKRTAR